MNGLKNVRRRHEDALTRVRWDQLETLLANYYRGQGCQVDHVGTGGTHARFDGGIDLKLRKDDQYILVQCKHWNAKQVPHNAVHELLGIMVNEGATGAILVTSGEFTKAAIEAATRQGHVQLIDGEDLRAMIGPVPEPEPSYDNLRSTAGSMAAHVGDRLLLAAEDRIRGGSIGRRQPAGSLAKTAGWVLLIKAVLPLVLIAFIALVGLNLIKQVAIGLQPQARASVAQPAFLSVPAAPAEQAVTQMPVPAPQASAPSITTRPMSAAERREMERRDAEAMRAFKENTPEM
jgi:hypothetical protein